MTSTGPTIWKKVQGDVLDVIYPKLHGIDDLSHFQSAVGQVWIPGKQPLVQLAAVVFDSPTRTLKVTLGSSGGWLASAVAGTWLYTSRVVFDNGQILTFPDEETDLIIVTARGV